MKYVIGIDGGGTKTLCLIATLEGAILGEGMGGPSNLVTTGLEETKASLEAAILAATVRSKLSPEDTCGGLCAGLAGAVSGQGVELVERALAEMTGAPRVMVTGDLHIAMAGALPPGPGVVVVAGTGSAGLGRDELGRPLRVGGHGHILGDEGGGYWIGKEAIRAILRSGDGRGVETSLTKKLDHARGDRSWPQFIKESAPSQVAELFPLVLEAATEGDPAARAILNWAGVELADMAANLARRIYPDGLPERVPTVTIGSILESAQPVRESFEEKLNELGLTPEKAVAGPAEGAIRMALDLVV